jgi:hypothetical protein
MRTDVLNQQYGSGDGCRQRRGHVEQNPYASGRSANHDDVAARREHFGRVRFVFADSIDSMLLWTHHGRARSHDQEDDEEEAQDMKM